MQKLLIFLLLGFASLLPALAFGAETDYVNLSQRNRVPLFDCSIFRDRFDRDACDDLTRGRPYRWSERGYAVNCSSFRTRREQNTCFDLATSITFSPRAFVCDRRDELCQVTRDAYANGEFPRMSERRVTTTTTTTIIRDDYPRTGAMCDGSSYDRAYQNWSAAKEEQRRRGETRTAIGIIATIGGIILSGSDNQTTSTIGQGLALGGAFVTAWGLIELSDANSTYAPHLDPACGRSYRREVKRVVVERRECISTRYTEQGWGSSRTYYEVRCENRSYVTYERFDEWERSNRWVH